MPEDQKSDLEFEIRAAFASESSDLPVAEQVVLVWQSGDHLLIHIHINGRIYEYAVTPEADGLKEIGPAHLATGYFLDVLDDWMTQGLESIQPGIDGIIRIRDDE